MGGDCTFELLDGETLAPIGFEELCAFGLWGGGSPVETNWGKLLLLLARA